MLMCCNWFYGLSKVNWFAFVVIRCHWLNCYGLLLIFFNVG